MGSSGGGNSGKVSFPTYMETYHGYLLGSGTFYSNMTTTLNNLLSSPTPFTGESAYDPDSDIAAFLSDLSSLDTAVTSLSPTLDWYNYLKQSYEKLDTYVISDSYINDEIAANDAIIDDRHTTEALPRFESGMRDVNAVMSSAFVIGKAVLEGFAQRDKNKFASSLRLTLNTQRNDMVMKGLDQMSEMLHRKIEYTKILASLSIEAYRIKVVMKKEEIGEQLDIDEKEALWDISAFQYANNTLASVSGAPSAVIKPVNKVQSALGGGLSGAAAGAMIGAQYGSSGGPYGALIGAVLGAGASYAANS